ncbi:hypothetical protein RHSP_75061 (plasmid) [Rhizobium freirei PRF 81]|uniref:Uncharacterized protein n=1 Tax=Rhizobium freirei PRF 81 TaxID=363754 RepID=N6US45_9HYPH|nr:hypothetical protein RHSP_75061 [Rhizobium freirei PRF 81]
MLHFVLPRAFGKNPPRIKRVFRCCTIASSVADATAHNDGRGAFQQRKQRFENTLDVRRFSVTRGCLLVCPTIENEERIRLVGALVEIVVEAALFLAGRADKLLEQCVDTVPVTRRCFKLNNEMLFVGLARWHVGSS